jgi:trk system potassium uptake protein TrkH
MLVVSFGGLIILGTFVLSLPFAHGRQEVSLIDALFTATSAVCVTGLVVVDTGLDYSFLGQVIILLLIQGGGLGVMTFAGLAAMLLGNRMSLRSQAVVCDSLFQRHVADGFKQVFFGVLKIAFTVEIVGAVLLFFFLSRDKPMIHSLYSAIFHAISAFCNAGFSLYSANLIELRDNSGVMFTVMVLVILGGLGHFTLVEVRQRITNLKREQLNWLSFHSRLVLGSSFLLIVVGAVGFLLFERESPLSWSDKAGAALFQSVSARTAGFNSVDIGSLSLASLFLLILLMFVGGSPGSCAGGVKTTTAAIWIARLGCRLVGRSDTIMFGRTIPVEIVRKVSVILALGLIWNTIGVLLLLATEAGAGAMHDVIFEQFSAFGTVGLSTGLTPKLSSLGKIWIIFTMFVGRLGPLTVALWMLRTDEEKVIYPDVKVMIG